MDLWQASDFIDKVTDELDLSEETFVDESELMGYLVEAVTRAEQIVQQADPDYFLTKSLLTLTSGNADVPLPSGIYASKIRRLIYSNGSDIYDIPRIKNISATAHIQSGQRFGYIPTNSLSDGQRLTFYPTPASTDSTSVTCWHIRNARDIDATTDEVDIPEAYNFILTFMRCQVWTKEMNPNLSKGLSDLQREEQLLIETLTERVPDENNNILIDFAPYDDMEGCEV